MNLNQRIEAFANLGDFLGQFTTKGIVKKEDSNFNSLFFDAFKMQIERAQEFNGWFTKDNVLKAFESSANKTEAIAAAARAIRAPRWAPPTTTNPSAPARPLLPPRPQPSHGANVCRPDPPA